MNIYFEKASLKHIELIFGWLRELHVQEFWDNTQGHKDDILNFVHGRKEPSAYAGGKYVYWIASANGYPFAMLMTIQETVEDHGPEIKLNYLSKTGNTYGIDYMIGDKNYFGKGYGAKTLTEFFDFFTKKVDIKADTFLIDPASDNPKAKHVYMKAGFEHVCDFIMSGEVSGSGKLHHLLIRTFQTSDSSKLALITATLGDYPLIQKMWPFYVYDLGRECGLTKGWECLIDPSCEMDDLKPYFNHPDKKAFLIKVDNKVIGFVLICKLEIMSENDFFLSEFFISANYQNKGFGKSVAIELFNLLKGKWALGVLPQNKKALAFWRKTLTFYTAGQFSEVFKTSQELKTVEHPEPYPLIIFTFDSIKSKQVQ